MNHINFILDPGLRRDDEQVLDPGQSLSWTRSRIPLRSTCRDDEQVLDPGDDSHLE